MNALYARARELFATAQLDWTAPGNVFRVLLVNSGYEFDEGDVWAEITPYGVATTSQLVGRAADDGYCTAERVILSAFPVGAPVKALIVFMETEGGASGLPIVYIEEGFGLPFVTNEADITLVWHASGVFRI